VRARQLGRMWLSPLDVVLDERKALIVQPDLLFISRAREWFVADRVRGAPDLVIEVLSPDPRIGRTAERVSWFAQYGVRECWLVHQDEREIEVISFRDGAIGDRHRFTARAPVLSDVFPEFTLRSTRSSPIHESAGAGPGYFRSSCVKNSSARGSRD
jgi:Uma2 family endonuclease